MIDLIVEDNAYDVWDLARKTKVFTKDELTCLAEDIRDSLDGSGDYTYALMEPEDTVAGFINFGPAPITKGSWFIYWIAVDPDRQGEGIGQKLLKYAESVIKKKKGRLVYIETSSSATFKPARKAYEKAKYEEAAYLKNYYKAGDGKHIYVKAVRAKK